MNRTVSQAFQPAGSGDFPVACCWDTGLESPHVLSGVRLPSGAASLSTGEIW